MVDQPVSSQPTQPTQPAPTANQLCRFYIVRHGETEWNTKKLLQGASDSPLTSTGLAQAVIAAEDFRDHQFAAVFSSDLLRAQRTAEIIAAEHQLLVQTTELIRERNFGHYEGQHVKVYRAELQEMVKNLTAEQRQTFKLAPEVESNEEVISRLLTFLRQTALAFPGKNVLVVTHSGVMRLLLQHLGFATYDEQSALKIHNLATIQLDCDGNQFWLRATAQIQKE